MKTQSTVNSIIWLPLRCGFVLFTVVAAFFALAPGAKALCSFDTAYGASALAHENGCNDNSAFGAAALGQNTTGTSNTACGVAALSNNQIGSSNTATGALALGNNTASYNTATGFQALENNSTGTRNTADGVNALNSNQAGHDNTATGLNALYSNTTINGVSGSYNTANGAYSLAFNTTGAQNTADGWSALYSNTTGNYNTATGLYALHDNTQGNDNTAEGFKALTRSTGSNNTALGYNAGFNLTTGSNNIVIGAGVLGTAGDSNTIRIGQPGLSAPKTLIAGIRGVTTANANAVPVVIDSAGQLGTVSSSRRFKKEIKPMDQASEAILALKPVTFQYKSDSTATPQFGLVAEEVAKVNPDLVVRDENGQIYTVRYDAVNAMLLNEFLKEHRKVEGQDRQLQKQAATIAEQQKQIESLTAGLQKVSDQLEFRKPAPRTAANDR